MNDIKYVKNTTKKNIKKIFYYLKYFKKLRQKINAPSKNRKK